MNYISFFLLEKDEQPTTLKQKMNLAANSGISHETMMRLAEHHPEHNHDENQTIRLVLASNPSLFKKDETTFTNKVAKKILEHKSNKPGTYEQIGRRNNELKKPMGYVFKMMANHYSEHARKVAADYRPHENYNRLKNDPSPLVHASLAKEFPENYDHNKAPMGARIIAGMAKHGPENHLEDFLSKEHPTIRAYVARHTTRLETMEHMAETEQHPRVRERLARNPNLPYHIRTFLIGDRDKKVSNIARHV